MRLAETDFTIPALIPINSSRVIPGFLGIPEVITQIVEFAVLPQDMAQDALSHNGSTFSLVKHGVNVTLTLYAIQTEVVSMTGLQLDAV